MDFAPDETTRDYQSRLNAFMDDFVYPAEPVYHRQRAEAGDPNFHPPVLEDLKREARSQGLWNLFLPYDEWGAGLTNLQYAHLAEITGRSAEIAPEAINCNAPDTGNMEVLALFGTDEHKEKWLKPLLNGEIASAFCMTEPAVASSDATNIEMSIASDGDDYVLNGRKWFASNALHANCQVFIVMGKTDPNAEAHRQQSMLVVPKDTPGITVVRGLPVFGYLDREGHAEIIFDDVRVPKTALLSGEGDGFAISQARLGPGRIHHCMRSIGMAERALDLLIDRAQQRVTFGQPLADRANIQDWIAEARVEIEATRLLVLKAAWMMDTVGNKEAATEIAAIKVKAPNMALTIIDRAIQVHGALGYSTDTPLAHMLQQARWSRFADGADEIHQMRIAQRTIAAYKDHGSTKRATGDLPL